MERKVCFITDASNWGVGDGVWREADICPKVDFSPFGNRGPRDYTPGGWGVGMGGASAETAPSSLTVILKSVISGLTSVILGVLGTVNHQFQGLFVPISLRSVLGTVAAYVIATARSSCS